MKGIFKCGNVYWIRYAGLDGKTVCFYNPKTSVKQLSAVSSQFSVYDPYLLLTLYPSLTTDDRPLTPELKW